MIDPAEFVEKLQSNDFNFYAGVPDSLLSSFCAYIDDCKSTQHIISANEGNAVALAIGHHLASNKYGVVYMQNSGLGNIVNPITSLADKKVYEIPMLLIIGWRGEPGEKDEPQHIKQGEVTQKQLDLLDIPYVVMDKDSDLNEIIFFVKEKLKFLNTPVAILVKKGSFKKYKSKKKLKSQSSLSRESALSSILDVINKDDLIVSTTGKTSRELFELRENRDESNQDFLTVGGMGHASSIALGISMTCLERKVICIDGDGAFLMHMGASSIAGFSDQSNFIHILLNNGMHESVGGQPTVGNLLDFKKIANASGYKSFFSISSKEDLLNIWDNKFIGPILIEIKIKGGSRDDLGRPTVTAIQNKISFMNKINKKK